MSRDRILTRYRQPSLRPSTSESPDRLSLPSFGSESWSRQSPLTPQPPTLLDIPPQAFLNALVHRDGDLFTAQVASRPTESIAFERGRIVALSTGQSEGPSSQPLTRQPIAEWRHLSAKIYREHSRTEFCNKRELGNNMSLVSYLRKEDAKSEVSKRRAKLPKRTPAKKKAKSQESISRKRSAGKEADVQERSLKSAKSEPKANIGKKVGLGSGALFAAATPQEVIEISDSEDDSDYKQDSVMLKYRARSWQSRSRVSLPPTTSPISKRTAPKIEASDSESDFAPDLVDAITVNGKHTEMQNIRQDLQIALEKNKKLEQEMDDVRQEHHAALDSVKKLQQEMEKREADALLGRQKQEARHGREVAALHEAARQLRNQLQTSQDTVTQRTEEHQALQARYDQERADCKKEQQGHEEILSDILKVKAAQEESRTQIEQDKSRLATEVEILKAAARLNRSFSMSSPVPSQSSPTDEERKEDNVRISYIKVKRQYDILRAAAKDISECTRTLDLGNFGDFGRYMKRLRASLEGETHGQQVMKSDDGI